MYPQIREDVKLAISPVVSAILTRVSQLFADEHIQSYLVGGFVRDTLLGRDTADLDIAVAANALEVAHRIATVLGGKYVPLDETNSVGRVVVESAAGTTADRWYLDFSTLKGDIAQDLAGRDFTIDAMAIDLRDVLNRGPLTSGRTSLATLRPSMIIDPSGGRDDLHNSIIRAVSETIFSSDAARLLRAVRLPAELDFSIDSQTEALIRQYCHLIMSVAGERVREELLRILAVPDSGRIPAYLDDLGLLTAMVPELAAAKGVEQPTVHYWDVFDHSIQTAAAVDFLLRRGTWPYYSEKVLAAVPWSTALSQHFDQEGSSGSTSRPLVKLAALLHDIAKPQTKTVDEDGRARFLGHASEGATTAVAILERLRFSTREIRLVEDMVKHHLRPTQMSQQGLPTPRAIYRYFRDTGNAGIDTLFLSLADHLATRGPNLDLTEWQGHAQMIEYVLAQRFKQESLAAPPGLIDGHDLINVLGLKPGPTIGKLLEAAREAQAAGEVTTRQDALDYVSRLLADPGQTFANRLPEREN